MATFMKGDRVTITAPISPFRMRPGRISESGCYKYTAMQHRKRNV